MQEFLFKYFSVFFKGIVFLKYKSKEFLFYRSRKHIKYWGVGTYGCPSIVSYDGISKLSVGKYCSMADNVSILLGSNHKHKAVPTYPICNIDNNFSTKDANIQGDVFIGNDVWIGYGATIIGPVSIGDGAIIGAGSVINRDVSAYSIVMGVPGQILRYRFSEDQIQKLLEIKWWNWNTDKIKNNIKLLYAEDINKFIDKFYGEI